MRLVSLGAGREGACCGFIHLVAHTTFAQIFDIFVLIENHAFDAGFAGVPVLRMPPQTLMFIPPPFLKTTKTRIQTF
jgi:hypothetical protein